LRARRPDLSAQGRENITSTRRVAGLFNDYRARDSLRKRTVKDLVELWRWLTYPGSTPERPRHIVTYPAFPSRYSSLAGLATHLRLRITNRFVAHPLAICAWEYKTQRAPDQALQKYAARQGLEVINAGALNIGKAFVDQCMRSAFGYSAEVDPLVCAEPFVEKADGNSRHDGRIHTRPLQPEQLDPRSIYQMLIDNTTGTGMVEDLRIPIFADVIPCVIVKQRRVEERFCNVARRVAMTAPHNLFSDDELDRLRRFCRAMHLDHAEIDVLRDRASGRIYVVDANKTPFSPPRSAPPAIKRAIVEATAAAFVQAFAPACVLRTGAAER
jgi:hypothetical protein